MKKYKQKRFYAALAIGLITISIQSCEKEEISEDLNEIENTNIQSADGGSMGTGGP